MKRQKSLLVIFLLPLCLLLTSCDYMELRAKVKELEAKNDELKSQLDELAEDGKVANKMKRDARILKSLISYEPNDQIEKEK